MLLTIVNAIPYRVVGVFLTSIGMGGAKLVDVEVMVSWAWTMTWKGLYPILSLSKTVYQKRISLTKKAMKQVEFRLQRNPLLPKWDILIQPLLLVIYFSKITLIHGI